MTDEISPKAVEDATSAEEAALVARGGLTAEDIKQVEIEIESEAAISSGQIWYASIIAFFAWMFSVYDFLMFGTLLPLIQDDFGWSTATAAAIATWVSVGTFLVSLTVGPITDYLGRRNALVITTCGAALSSGLSAFTFAPWYLVVVRSFSGLGYSEQAVNTTYLSEIYGAKNRGFIYAFIQGGWPIGVMFGALMAALLVDSVGWRGTFLVATFPLIIILIARTRLKESPRYIKLAHVRNVMKAGRTAEAEQLGKLWGVDTAKASAFSYLQLFQRDTLRHTIFISLGYGANWVGCQIMLILTTTVLTKGLGGSYSIALWSVVGSNLLAYIGYIFFGKVGDMLGRRETISIGFFLAAVIWGVMLLVARDPITVFIFYSAGLFCEIGVFSAIFTYIGESFPTRMRGTAAGWVNAIGQLGAIVGGLSFAALLASMPDTSHSVLVATWWAGVFPTLLAAFLMWGCNRVKPRQVLEDIAT